MQPVVIRVYVADELPIFVVKLRAQVVYMKSVARLMHPVSSLSEHKQSSTRDINRSEGIYLDCCERL